MTTATERELTRLARRLALKHGIKAVGLSAAPVEAVRVAYNPFEAVIHRRRLSGAVKWRPGAYRVLAQWTQHGERWVEAGRKLGATREQARAALRGDAWVTMKEEGDKP